MDVFFPPQMILKGKIVANPSKSLMQRVLAAVFLAPKNSEIGLKNPSLCQDASAVLRILEQAGLKVLEKTENRFLLKVPAQGFHPIFFADCGESGLCLRVFSILLALNNAAFTMQGKGSLLQRDLSDLIAFLEDLGLKVLHQNYKLPLQISGFLNPNGRHWALLKSSQYLSGLLMAAPLLTHDSRFSVTKIQSFPYIQTTLDLLRDLGVGLDYRLENGKHIFEVPGNQNYQLHPIEIEGDWSGSAFWIVAGLLFGQGVQIEGLNLASNQADKAILEVLSLLDVYKDQDHSDALNFPVYWENGILHIKPSPKILEHFYFDAENCPDLFPVLALLATFCDGESVISGTHRLRNKESDRLEAIVQSLQKLGIQAWAQANALHIVGTEKIEGNSLQSFGDHRMAMMGALLSLGSRKGVIVENFSVVEKSYPHFLAHYFELSANSDANAAKH